MSTTDMGQYALDYQRIEEAIAYIEAHYRRQPSLSEIARAIHMSDYHFQRLFSRWVGISPKRFVQYLTKEYAKELLRESPSVLDAAYATGLSGPGRLHDLFVNCEAVTPGEYKNQGEGLVIEYGIHPTPFGCCLLATTRRGICALSFLPKGEQHELELLRRNWSRARLRENRHETSRLVQKIFFPTQHDRKEPLNVLLKGTNFQIKTWESLLRIPFGRVVSYEDIADALGRPRAVRAVANAVASNPVPFLVPCHRVIRKLGEFGGYQGGTARKKALLGWEAAKLAQLDDEAVGA